MYLLADDTEERANLTTTESLALMAVFYTSLDDMTFNLTYVGRFLTYQISQRKTIALGYRRITQRVILEPLDIVVLTLAEWVYNSN